MAGKFLGFSTGVVIDVETTGLSPSFHRIVSIAALRADFYTLVTRMGAHVETFVTRVNPQRKIPADASAIHGIFDHDVEHEAPFAEIAAQLREFIGDGPIIGHNVSFDKSFLSAEFQRSRVTTLGRIRSLCTMSRMCALLEPKGIYRSTISVCPGTY